MFTDSECDDTAGDGGAFGASTRDGVAAGGEVFAVSGVAAAGGIACSGCVLSGLCFS